MINRLVVIYFEVYMSNYVNAVMYWALKQIRYLASVGFCQPDETKRKAKPKTDKKPLYKQN